MQFKVTDVRTKTAHWVDVPLKDRVITAIPSGKENTIAGKINDLNNKTWEYNYKIPDYKYEAPVSKSWVCVEYMLDEKEWCADVRDVKVSEAAGIRAAHLMIGDELLAVCVEPGPVLKFLENSLSLTNEDTEISPLRILLWYEQEPTPHPRMVCSLADRVVRSTYVKYTPVNDKEQILVFGGGEIVLAYPRSLSFKFLD